MEHLGALVFFAFRATSEAILAILCAYCISSQAACSWAWASNLVSTVRRYLWRAEMTSTLHSTR